MKWDPETAQETRIHPVTNKLEKKCSKCGGVKPVEYFGVGNKKTMTTGYQSACKRCRNKGQRGLTRNEGGFKTMISRKLGK